MRCRKINKETGKSRFTSVANAIRVIQREQKEQAGGVPVSAAEIRVELQALGKIECKNIIYKVVK